MLHMSSKSLKGDGGTGFDLPSVDPGSDSDSDASGVLPFCPIFSSVDYGTGSLQLAKESPSKKPMIANLTRANNRAHLYKVRLRFISYVSFGVI